MPENIVTVRVRVRSALSWQCTPSQGNWVAVNDPLKLTVQGETWGDLMQNIADTLSLLLLDLLSENELDTFLRENGWQAMGQIPARPDGVRFDVPFVPAMTGMDDSSRNLYQ